MIHYTDLEKNYNINIFKNEINLMIKKLFMLLITTIIKKCL